MNKKQILATSVLGATLLFSGSFLVNKVSKEDLASSKQEALNEESLPHTAESSTEETNQQDQSGADVQTPVTEDAEPSVNPDNDEKDESEKQPLTNEYGNINNMLAVKPVVKPENNDTVKPENNVTGNPEVKPENNGSVKPEVKPENNETVKPEVKPETPETKPEDNTPSNPNDTAKPNTPPVEDGTGNDNTDVTPESAILVVNDDFLTDGAAIIKDNTFKDVQIDVSAADAKITLENVEIEGELTLKNGKSYAVEVKDSSVKTIKLLDSVTTFTTGTVDANVNLTLTNVRDLQTVAVNGDIHIDGNVEIPSLNVTGGNVFVDALANTIAIEETAQDVEVTVNKDAKEIHNHGTASVIKVNSDVSSITSNGHDTAVYIKEGATVQNAVMSGESERVMGNGALESATVNGANVGILTNINQNNVTVSDSATNVTIGKEETIKIDSIKLHKQGTISFTLNQATDQPLTLDDISIICHGGKSMTVVNVSTSDNKTYTLTTAYYKDNTYELYLTLPNSKVISKEFVYSYNHPTASDVIANRVSDTEATIDLYDVDEGGYLYYILVEKTNARQSANMTQEYVKANGTKVNLTTGYNEVKITNLDPDKQYDVYYVLEAFDGRVSPVYGGDSVVIGGYDEKPEADEWAVESIEEKVSNTIVFNFNKPVENLTVDDIQMVCPLGTILTTTNATLTSSNSGKTWTMVIPQNYQHADNKYTATIKMPDGSFIQGTFVTHFNYPFIMETGITRPSENELRFEFDSDESGTVYYGVYEWNEEYNANSNNPRAEDVLAGKVEGTHQQDLAAGSNVIELQVGEVTKYTRIWVLYVDYAGNYRTGWTDYHKVPAYVPPVVEEEPETPEVETTLEITQIDVYEGWTGLGIDLYFNEKLGSILTKNDVTLESLSGVALPSTITMDIWNEPSVTAIEFTNVKFQAGDYKVTIQTIDSQGNLVKVSKVFTVN